MNLGAAGLYRLNVFNEQGELVHDTQWQKNLITDKGIEYFLSGGNSGSGFYGILGTGSAAPQKSDEHFTPAVSAYLQLDSKLSAQYRKDETQELYAFSIYKGTAHNDSDQTYEIKEVGLGSALLVHNQNPVAYTRALLPQSFTLKPNWYVTIEYELRAYFPREMSTHTIQIDDNGTQKNYNVKVQISAGRINEGVTPFESNIKGITLSYYFLGGVSQGAFRAFYYMLHQADLPTTPFDSFTSEDLFSASSGYEAVQITVKNYTAGLPYREIELVFPHTRTLKDSAEQFNLLRLTSPFGNWLIHYAAEDDGSGIKKDNTNEVRLSFRISVNQYAGEVKERT